MTTDDAKTLRESDDVLWTWTLTPDHPTSPGTVTAANCYAVEILWDDFPIQPSIYYFDEDLRWSHIERPTEEPHYEPLPKPTVRRMRRRRPRQ